MLKDKIHQLSEKYKSEVIATRRHLHANPELSFRKPIPWHSLKQSYVNMA